MGGLEYEIDEAPRLRQTVNLLARKKRSLMTKKLLWRYQGSVESRRHSAPFLCAAHSGHHDHDHDHQAHDDSSCANCAALKIEMASLKDKLQKLQGLGGEMAQQLLSTTADNLVMGKTINQVAGEITDATKQMEGTQCSKARRALQKLKGVSVFERLFNTGPRHRRPSYVEKVRAEARLATQQTYKLDKQVLHELREDGVPQAPGCQLAAELAPASMVQPVQLSPRKPTLQPMQLGAQPMQLGGSDALRFSSQRSVADKKVVSRQRSAGPAGQPQSPAAEGKNQTYKKTNSVQKILADHGMEVSGDVEQEQPELRQRSHSLTPPDEGGVKPGSAVRSSSACPAEIAANNARGRGRPPALAPVSARGKSPSVQRMRPAPVDLAGGELDMPTLASPMSAKASPSKSPARSQAVPMGMGVVGLDTNALRAATPTSPGKPPTPAKRENGHLPKVTDARRQSDRTGSPQPPRSPGGPRTGSPRSLSPGAVRRASDSMTPRPRLSGIAKASLQGGPR